MSDDIVARFILAVDAAWETYRMTPGIHTGALSYVIFRRVMTDALHAERRAVWEELMGEIGRNETVSPHIGPLWNMGWSERSSSLLKWCRVQVEKETT